jgi:hypothetical protein
VASDIFHSMRSLKDIYISYLVIDTDVLMKSMDLFGPRF